MKGRSQGRPFFVSAQMSDPTSFTPLEWTEDGAPRSARFGDVYFAREDGLAETRAVFLDGCGLPDAWRDRQHFTVAELGFGTGLNIAALLTLWRKTAPPDGRLHVFTIEAFPIAATDAGRALAAWPELSDAASALTAAWPSAARGFQRLDLPRFNATLDIAIIDVEAALRGWTGQADAWFLDGFAPAANPTMWSEAVLSLVAQRSAPGARAATFTVAGSVRRGLSAAGFAVDKRPGHGRKRERLEARLSGSRVQISPPRTVAIIGAGIAGAALARAFRAQGVQAVVIDAGEQAASGNPAALVTPGFDASGRAPGRLQAQAFGRALDIYRGETPAAMISEGVLRQAKIERDLDRFAKVAGQDFFAPGALSMTVGGLFIRDGLVLEPQVVLDAWLPGERLEAKVIGLEPHGERWRLAFADGQAPLDVDVAIIAAGWGAAELTSLPLTPIRGQLSLTASDERPPALVGGDYLIPTRHGLLFGATHERGSDDTAVLAEDHRRNLAGLARLAPEIAARIDPERLEGRSAVRAATPDQQPLAGALAPGLFVLGGLGSRGFTTAPVLAEHVCALALGIPSPLPAALAALVEPNRFS
jgi:tRNA 5-methylaminomethyl-2-thiouridine biosynthesis bifunctional protein